MVVWQGQRTTTLLCDQVGPTSKWESVSRAYDALSLEVAVLGISIGGTTRVVGSYPEARFAGR